MPSLYDEYNRYYATIDLSAFAGEWVALVGKNVVAHGINAKQVFVNAKKKYPAINPYLTKVPTKPVMLW